jgi:hypothetical protein
MALEFPLGSATDMVTFGTLRSINPDQMTFILWVKRTQTNTGTVGLLSKGDSVNYGVGFIVSVTSTQQLDIFHSRNFNVRYTTNSSPLPLNTWAFIAIQFDRTAPAGSLAQAYQGTLTSSPTPSTFGSISDGSGAFTNIANFRFIVGNMDSPQASFPGQIAQVAFFNKILSYQEILRFYYKFPVSRDELGYLKQNVIGLWNLGIEGLGKQRDFSGNNLPGTLLGSQITVQSHVPGRPIFPNIRKTRKNILTPTTLLPYLDFYLDQPYPDKIEVVSY